GVDPIDDLVKAAGKQAREGARRHAETPPAREQRASPHSLPVHGPDYAPGPSAGQAVRNAAKGSGLHVGWSTPESPGLKSKALPPSPPKPSAFPSAASRSTGARR